MQWFLSVGWYSRRLLSANKTTFTDSSGRCGSDVSRQFCAGTFTRFRRRSSQSAGCCVAAKTGFKAVISNCKNTACPLETLLLSASCVVSLIKMASGVLSFSVCVFEVSVFTCTHLYKIKRLLPERIKWLFEMTESWNMLKLHVVTSRDCCWVWETWPNDVSPPPGCPAHPVQHQSSRHSRRPRWRHPPETVARVQRAEHARLRCKWQTLDKQMIVSEVEAGHAQCKRHLAPCVSLQVSIYLPPLKTMKNVVDRMKNLSNFLVGSHSSKLLKPEKRDPSQFKTKKSINVM